MLTKLENGLDFTKRILRDIKDPFARELLDLWNDRHLKGYAILYQDYISKGPLQGYKPSPVQGFILVEKKNNEAIIRGLFVDPKARRRQVGSRLIQYVQKIANQSREGKVYGEKTVWVNITSGAESIYTKMGFNIVGTRKDFPDQKIAYWGEVSPEEVSRVKSLKCK